MGSKTIEVHDTFDPQVLRMHRLYRSLLFLTATLLTVHVLSAQESQVPGETFAPHEAGVTPQQELQGEVALAEQTAADRSATGTPPSHSGHRHASVTSGLWNLMAVYCSLIVCASLAGGWLPHIIQLTHNRMQLMVSFVGGLMLGIGLFHLLPHAFAELGSLDRAIWWTMVGLLTMFFLIRTFHFHQHEPVDFDQTDSTRDFAAGSGNDHDHDHDTDHQHDHANESPATASSHLHTPPPICAHHHDQSHSLSWMGVAFGLSLHTLIDGLALGASMQADADHGAPMALFGVGTFLAIMLHKPLDAVSITSLMAAGGWSAGWRHAINAGFSLMCPLGAALFFLGVAQFSDSQHIVIGCALAFSAGVFLCISLGDLLPEMEFHSHNRLPLSASLLMGVVLAYGIRFLEPTHAHGDASHTHSETHSRPDSQPDSRNVLPSVELPAGNTR